MVNQGILGGLKLALSKGESLKQAMMSFYNAGYKKQKIEEAARALQRENFEQQKIQPRPEQIKQPPAKPEKPSKPKKQIPIQKISAYEEPAKIQPKPSIKHKIDTAVEQLKNFKKPKETPQKISAYEKTQEPKGKLIITLLIFFLLFLLGALVAVFLFRQELVDFFNKLS